MKAEAGWVREGSGDAPHRAPHPDLPEGDPVGEEAVLAAGVKVVGGVLRERNLADCSGRLAIKEAGVAAQRLLERVVHRKEPAPCAL